MAEAAPAPTTSPAASTPAAVPAAASPAQAAPAAAASSPVAGATPPSAAAPAAASPEPVKAAEPAKADAPAKPGAASPRSIFDDGAAEAPKDDKAADKSADAPVEPIKYDIKLPDGFDAEPERLEAFKAEAAELKLAPEAAQKLVDRHVAEVQTAVQGIYDQWEEQKNAWQKEIRDDPEIGGAKLPATLNSIRAGIQNALNGAEYDITTRLPDGSISKARLPATKAFFDALAYTGAANHPVVVRTLAALTRGRSEGGPVQGHEPAAPPKTLAAKLYPKSQGE